MERPEWNVMVATCPSRTSLARIANKWTAMIVMALDPGRLRFGEIREAVGGISGKVLSETLRQLERDGVVSRTAYDQMPPRVEYELTPLGRSLHQPMAALAAWAQDHIEEVQLSRNAFDEREDERLVG
ncbi:winged helix-turn-helix transcriptional regulator [Galactobacter caseinivorans]|uniref:Transcriptional regulator n=1 Tax=Galactobacter caseinivorans TaxID=2676123 RepID=A0A496PLY7_9MICC|nr:helix-turn-helix domain-containing protein [Galactobacter caseinivorans]RKW71550.1 transcriptional regulator [Galactobacter caseinivorans]